MEKHVTSLELSKRLKALGVKQESEFYWIKVYKRDGTFIEVVRYKSEINGISKDLIICSAFLASELGELLPDIINPCEYLTIQIGTTMMTPKWGWKVYYQDSEKEMKHADTMQDALGLMLEYLIQNKMIGGI